ncbi:MAG TPA: 6-phosphogluconolactonase [Allosphingosinicella sp.]|nr:6-phosphogluconolactonase [Allosphingosinicella sp.]
MTDVEWWEFDSAAEMAEQVAGDIGFVIESALEAHGGARLAIPGGSTPDLIYKALAAQDLDWEKVTLIPTDDRLVGPSDPMSNFGRLKALFGSKGANLVSLVDEGALGDYREAGRLADQRLSEIDWPLDLVCLGMAEDGHTASIFPGPDFDRAIAGPRGRRAVGVHPDPMPATAAVDRVTLTLDALSSARTAMLVVRGEPKRVVLESAIDEGPLSLRPIGRVLAGLEADVDIFWSPD